jgi:calcium permeable stress-gated cation channel
LILLPVNATGKNGLSQLNRISTSNIDKPARYWAHAIVAWLFFGNTSFQILNLVHLKKI